MVGPVEDPFIDPQKIIVDWVEGGSGPSTGAYSPPRAVIMSANEATMEAFRKSKVLWWVLLMIILPAFQKKFQRVSWGSRSSTGSQRHF